MKVSELIWVKRESKSDTEFIFTTETPLGKMAVVSKLIWSARSIMTGFRDMDDTLWSATDFDIRNYPELTLVEAIDKIKTFKPMKF